MCMLPLLLGLMLSVTSFQVSLKYLVTGKATETAVGCILRSGCCQSFGTCFLVPQHDVVSKSRLVLSQFPGNLFQGPPSTGPQARPWGSQWGQVGMFAPFQSEMKAEQ